MGNGTKVKEESDDSGVKCFCYLFLFIGLVVGLVIFVIVISNRADSSDGGTSYYGGGSYYGGSRGGGGWGGGGRGGCFSEITSVWTKNETQSDKHAELVMIKNLKEGSLVGTLDRSLTEGKKYKFTWTRATDITISSGDWRAHTFVFANGHSVTVTSPHLMIVKRNGELYFLRADNVKIGDEMIVKESFAQIIVVKRNRIYKKVAVETEDGTIQANGVFASGLCDQNPDAANRIVKYETYIKKYISNHFGNEYQYRCMDEVTWKKNYLMNNGLLR